MRHQFMQANPGDHMLKAPERMFSPGLTCMTWLRMYLLIALGSTSGVLQPSVLYVSIASVQSYASTTHAAFRPVRCARTGLLSLANVIQALVDGHKHVPYRNSKLTRLLQDSLGTTAAPS